MDHNEVCDILNLAAGVTEEIDFDEDLDEVEEISSIEEIINTLETALYKLSFIVHHNNYCSILVKTLFLTMVRFLVYFFRFNRN